MQEITTNFLKKRFFFFIITAKKDYYACINRIVETDNECVSMEGICRDYLASFPFLFRGGRAQRGRCPRKTAHAKVATGEY